MDGDDCREIGRDELLNVLCTGEQRALYMLNIIFEIRAREKENYQTILVLDDIADSFDYKNKFAIIEYLKEIVSTNNYTLNVKYGGFKIDGKLGFFIESNSQ